VHEALHRLEREIAQARQEGRTLFKIIHGYGSTGAGGDIRIAVQLRLRELSDTGSVRGCIFGEEWSTTSEAAWKLLQPVRS
jgi:DNA-nicking Smr family endonuclease